MFLVPWFISSGGGVSSALRYVAQWKVCNLLAVPNTIRINYAFDRAFEKLSNDHGEHQKYLKSRDCGYLFLASFDLLFQAQNPLDAVPFFRKDKCLLCKAVNLNESEVLQHYMEMHLHTKYVCDICQSHFPSDAKLKEHTELRHSLVNSMKTRAATEAKIQENFNKKLCAIDMQHFETINEIRDHFLFAHKEYKLFQCDECDECYLNSRLLKDHQKLHSDENGSKKVCRDIRVGIEMKLMANFNCSSQLPLEKNLGLKQRQKNKPNHQKRLKGLQGAKNVPNQLCEKMSRVIIRRKW